MHVHVGREWEERRYDKEEGKTKQNIGQASPVAFPAEQPLGRQSLVLVHGSFLLEGLGV